MSHVVVVVDGVYSQRTVDEYGCIPNCLHIDVEEVTPFLHGCAKGHIHILEWLLFHGVPSSEMARASKGAHTFITTSIHTYVHILFYAF